MGNIKAGMRLQVLAQRGTLLFVAAPNDNHTDGRTNGQVSRAREDISEQ